MRSVLLLRRFVLCAVALLAAVPAAAQAPADRFLVLSDFHFDPFDGLTPPEFQALTTAPLDEWPRLLAAQPAAAYGRDAPYSLLQSSLDDARRRVPDPDFILFPGDFMAHGWQAKYDRLAARPRSADPAAYREFTTRVMRFIGERVRRAYPNAPFFPVLGNDDSFCGDYMIAPDSPFLAMFADVWEPLLHVPAGDEAERDGERRAFRKSVSEGGYYTLRLPRMKWHRLVALNTVFCSTLYDNACGPSTATPALDQLRWLETTLDAAREARESVWLLMHIPPGIDGYSTSQAQGTPRPFWQPELTAAFLRLVEKHRATIRFAVAGHTHMDDFRVIRRNGAPPLVTKIVPAISPIFGNNPGYQAFRYDRESGAVHDYTTYGLPLAVEGREAPGAAAAAPLWRVEYLFRATYDVPDLDAASITRLCGALANESPAQKAYLRNYTVGATPTAIPIDILRCAIENVTVAGFNACHRGVSPVD